MFGRNEAFGGSAFGNLGMGSMFGDEGAGFLQSNAGRDSLGMTQGGEDNSQFSKAEKCLVPMKIGPLLRAVNSSSADMALKFLSKPFTIFTIIGTIDDVCQSDSRISFKLHDQTGQIQAQMNKMAMYGSDRSLTPYREAKLEDLVDGCWIYVCGRIDNFGSEVPTINVSFLRRIKDFNEIAFHDILFGKMAAGLLQNYRGSQAEPAGSKSPLRTVRASQPDVVVPPANFGFAKVVKQHLSKLTMQGKTPVHLNRLVMEIQEDDFPAATPDTVKKVLKDLASTGEAQSVHADMWLAAKGSSQEDLEGLF